MVNRECPSLDELGADFDPQMNDDPLFLTLRSLVNRNGTDQVLYALQQVYAQAAGNPSHHLHSYYLMLSTVLVDLSNLAV